MGAAAFMYHIAMEGDVLADGSNAEFLGPFKLGELKTKFPTAKNRLCNLCKGVDYVKDLKAGLWTDPGLKYLPTFEDDSGLTWVALTPDLKNDEEAIKIVIKKLTEGGSAGGKATKAKAKAKAKASSSIGESSSAPLQLKRQREDGGIWGYVEGVD